MELAWNNPSPNRTVNRPSAWQVIRRDGTSRVIATHEMQATAGHNLEHGVKEVFNDFQIWVSPHLCF